MFNNRYFAGRLFAPHYFAEVGADPTTSAPGRASVKVTGQKRAVNREVTQ